MRYSLTRNTGTKNEYRQKKFSKHSGRVKLYECILQAACTKKAVPGRGRLRRSIQRDAAALPGYCTTTDNVTPGGNVTVS
jgi:hypothetical protein